MRLPSAATQIIGSRIAAPAGAARPRAFRAVPVIARQAEGGDKGGVPAPAPRSASLAFPSMALSPFGARFRDLEREMEDMMRAFFPTASLAETMPALRGGELSLAVDVREEADRYVIAADVPGMARGDVKVQVTPDHVLHITGERKAESKEEGEGGMVRLERSYGAFTRAFRLPDHVDAAGIKAELKAGVLELSVPKKEEEEAGAQTISIDVGEAAAE